MNANSKRLSDDLRDAVNGMITSYVDNADAAAGRALKAVLSADATGDDYQQLVMARRTAKLWHSVVAERNSGIAADLADALTRVVNRVRAELLEFGMSGAGSVDTFRSSVAAAEMRAAASWYRANESLVNALRD